MNIKIIISIIFAGIIAGISIFNIIIAINYSGFSNMTISNIEALAINEGEVGWTIDESNTTYKVNGEPIYNRISVDCTKGGPNYSCTKSCKIRYYENGTWGSWGEC